VQEWLDDQVLETFAAFRSIPQHWVRICAGYQRLRGNPAHLTLLVDHLRAQAVQDAATPLAQTVLSFEALRTVRQRPRRRYLDWLQERAIIMLYGPRGVGKSFALLGLSVSLTTGTPFLAWQTQTPTGVLYVDGEMTIEDLQTRAGALAHGQTPACLSFLSSEHVFNQTGRELTLAGDQARGEVEAILAARPALTVLILDNISCLFPGLDENKKKDWEPINAWFLRLRHRGITTIFGHHAAKGGEQRGTSGREDNIDMTIKLSLPPGHQAKDGCHFHWKFTKTRGMKGQALDALDVRLDEIDGRTTWTYARLESTRTDAVKLMLADGIPPPVIAEELGVDRSYVYRVKRTLGL
jgi:putative DNA primase/helicase